MTSRGVLTRIVRPPLGPAERLALAAALHEGAVLAYPTETYYALGGNATDPEVVRAVFRLKGRPAGKALLLLIDGAADGGAGLGALARQVDPAARLLMARFWPGALSLVLWAAEGLPAHLRDDRGTVALRWSPHPLLAELLRIGGVPLIGTSANRSGEPPARDLSDVLAAFGAGTGAGVTIALDGGTTAGGAPSTLLDATARPFRVLREGAIPAAALAAALAATHPDAAPHPAAAPC
ncbi:MAG: threonylcarbamoyl-AMP synthase [Candidatus Lambdaproteobacteria bacterium]|nr:threonylcarbamoyl-AMP synthase [Candidatus Lambdaproteobacteria bacterium]